MKKSPKETNRRNFGKFCFLVLSLILFILSGTSTYALDLLGSPASDIRKDQFNIGIEYSRSSMDFDLTGGSWRERIAGQPGTSGKSADFTLEDFDSDKLNVYLGYGVDRNFEWFARIGASSAEFGDSLFDNSESFDSEYTPSLGAGMRMTFIKDYKMKIGAIAQIGWTKYNAQLDSALWPAPGFVTADLKEFQVSLGVEYKWADDVYVYGGPFFHYMMGEFDFDYVSFDVPAASIITSEYSWDIEASSSIGGYLGTKVDFGDGSYLNLEYLMTGDSSLFGAGMVMRY